MEKNQEYSKVISHIENLIKSGELSMGDRLPAERSVAEKTGVGRNSVREALCVLEGMGIITRRQGSGNYITGNTEESIRQIFAMMLALGTVSPEDICSFRRIMEKAACMVLLDRGIGGESAKKIGEILSQMQDDENLPRLDREFHYEIIRATDNELLINIIEAVSWLYEEIICSVISGADSDKRKLLVRYHQDIFEGLSRGKSADVLEAIDMHYNLIEETL
ncbi:MAG: GntR family transcriptional regulator [Bacillota bacterium]|nr:GntR family transcriptional regulator [Bacillota bacterium]